MNPEKYEVLELFAGCGGLALGLEKAGIQSVGLVEKDKQCCNTLRKNRQKWQVVETDIIDYDPPKEYRNIDIISGGIPCQSFSIAGQRKGFDDKRGSLFFEYKRIVQTCHPKIFVIENVAGMLSHNHGSTFKTILDEMSSIGYKCYYKLLNSVGYSVPQKRKRLFIIGIDKKYKKKFIFPEPTNRIITLKEALKNVPKSEGQNYSEEKKKILDLIPPGGCWTSLPVKLQKKYLGKSYNSGGGKRGIARRLSWDEPCLTLTTSPMQKQTERCHPDETRPLTIREYARIQTFPDKYQFCGSISSQYKQIGNAVPVELAYAIGRSIIDYLKTIKV